jgi:hypothetical protein
LVAGWYAETSLVKGDLRVSSGTCEAVDGSVTKQSSISGSSGPRVNSLLDSRPLYAVGSPVGIPPSSTGKYWLEQRVITVPSIVGCPERLKYLLDD